MKFRNAILLLSSFAAVRIAKIKRATETRSSGSANSSIFAANPD
jgi:hypothetical protein